MGNDRSEFLFAAQVHAAFGFLNTLGFEEVEAKPTLVRYRNDGVKVHLYHGRRSYEASANMAGHGVRYSIAEVVAVDEPKGSHEYRPRVARTPDALALALDVLCAVMKLHGAKALSNDPSSSRIWSAIEIKGRRTWNSTFSHDSFDPRPMRHFG